MIIKHTQTLALQTVADEKHYLLKPGVGSVNNSGKALTGGHTAFYISVSMPPLQHYKK